MKSPTVGSGRAVANWTWPHTPSSRLARLLLIGGPFDGEEAAFAPADTQVPVQIVWSGWMPWGFDAWLYEWHGETTIDRGRTDALIYRPVATVAADAIPPIMADAADLWADTCVRILDAYRLPPEVLG